MITKEEALEALNAIADIAWQAKHGTLKMSNAIRQYIEETSGLHHQLSSLCDKWNTECDDYRQENIRLQSELVKHMHNSERYTWLRTHGLQRAWVSLGTDCDGENYAQFKCEFKVPKPPNLPYEDDEGLEWSDSDFDAAIDEAIAAVCEKSDRYRGDYFAEKIRAIKE